jgi:PAS domain S-box-containing protein
MPFNFCDLMGLAHDKIDGRSCFRLRVPKDLNETKERFKPRKLPYAAPFRFRLRRVDGSEVWTNIQGTAIHTAGGAVAAISATVTSAEPSVEPQTPIKS